MITAAWLDANSRAIPASPPSPNWRAAAICWGSQCAMSRSSKPPAWPAARWCAGSRAARGHGAEECRVRGQRGDTGAQIAMRARRLGVDAGDLKLQAEIQLEKILATLAELKPQVIEVPGDPSSAAFFIVAALIVPGSIVFVQ